MIFRLYTYQGINEITLFESEITNKDDIIIKTDIGKCYATDFLNALLGNFEIEVYNKKYNTSEILKIEGEDYIENMYEYLKICNKLYNDLGIYAEIIK